MSCLDSKFTSHLEIDSPVAFSPVTNPEPIASSTNVVEDPTPNNEGLYALHKDVANSIKKLQLAYRNRHFEENPAVDDLLREVDHLR